MYENLKLGLKLNLLLIFILLPLTLTAGISLSNLLQNNAEQVIAEKASMLMETMNAVRDYTSTQVNPELSSRLETEAVFLPQTVPAYSAREVFEHFRTDDKYNQFFYKEATLNPTNVRDKADNFERNIIQSFENDSEDQKYGYRSIPGGKLFYIARPLKITKESCLRCHSTPDVAPPSLLASYGSENGFGWQLNEIIGAQIISVPSSQIFVAANKLRYLVISRIALFLLGAIILLNLFLKRNITEPLQRMYQFTQKLSIGDMSAEFEQTTNDEIGMLASSLNRLKIIIKTAMNIPN